MRLTTASLAFLRTLKARRKMELRWQPGFSLLEASMRRSGRNTSHQALDKDKDFQEEVRNAARTFANAVRLSREGKLERSDGGLVEPNPK